MSEKISINVKSVGLNLTHNFIVPDDMNAAKVANLIAKTFQDEYPGAFLDRTRGHFLMQETSGRVIKTDCSLRQAGITNGEKFIFV